LRQIQLSAYVAGSDRIVTERRSQLSNAPVDAGFEIHVRKSPLPDRTEALVEYSIVIAGLSCPSRLTQILAQAL
jgi:hypothetical protein